MRSAAPREVAPLFSWLNEGLRGGKAGRLEQEFPTLARDPGPAGHVVALVEGRFASHALAHCTRAQAGRHALTLGMIGMVYTDPSLRGEGLARRCIRGALERVERRGAGLCLLWSELDAFYRALDFVRGGRERFFWLHRDQLDGPGGPIAAEHRFDVSPPREDEWERLEALYRAHAAHVERPAGSLRLLAAGPDCELVVARRRGGAVAYAARGRGDDFPDIVHEWAGDPSAVWACLASLCGSRDWLGLLCPPTSRAMMAMLNAAGFQSFPNDLAWFHVLDAGRVWAELRRSAPSLDGLRFSGGGSEIRCEGDRRSVSLDAAAFLGWVLRGDRPDGLGDVLGGPALDAIEAELPVPLYLWGFDSV